MSLPQRASLRTEVRTRSLLPASPPPNPERAHGARCDRDPPPARATTGPAPPSPCPSPPPPAPLGPTLSEWNGSPQPSLLRRNGRRGDRHRPIEPAQVN